MGILNINDGFESFDYNTREWQNKLRFRYIISDKDSYIRKMLGFDDYTVPQRLRGPYVIHDEFLKYITCNNLWTELKKALDTVNDTYKMKEYIMGNYMTSMQDNCIIIPDMTEQELISLIFK